MSAARRCPPNHPPPGFTHLQFEALLTAARESANRNDFALAAQCRASWALRIFEATGADIGDLGEEHGHRVLRVCGKGGKVVLVPLPPAVGRAIDRAIGTRTAGPILLNNCGTRMDRHAGTRRLRRLAEDAGARIPPAASAHAQACSSRPCLTPGSTCETCKSPPATPTPRTTMRYDRARKNLDRHPNYILTTYMASGT